MTDKTDKTARPNNANTREDRLKAALKANMAKRKAQTRARKTNADQNEKE